MSSAAAMVSSIRFNLGQKRSARRKKKYATTKRIMREFYTPDITKEELEEIKANIRAKGKKRRTIEYSISIIATIIVITLIYVYIF